MIHGDAGVAAQYLDIKNSEKLDHLICRIKVFFSNGTILVPAFTYSFTKGDYHIDKSESSIGLFSRDSVRGEMLFALAIRFLALVFGKNGQFFE